MELEIPQSLLDLAEEFAVYFENSGLPRIAGRILGLLMVCEPPHVTPTDLVDTLAVSKASVSNMLRLLTSVGLVEKAPVADEPRSSTYRLRQDGFASLFEKQLERLTTFVDLANRTLEQLGPHTDRAARMRELRALHVFWQQEMPKLIEKWRERREQLAREGFPVNGDKGGAES